MARVFVKGGVTSNLWARGKLMITSTGFVVLTTGKVTENTFEAVVLEGEASNNTCLALDTGKVAIFQKNGSGRFIGTVTLTEE